MSHWWKRWRRLLTASMWLVVLVVEVVWKQRTGWLVFAAFCLGCQLKWGYDDPICPAPISPEEAT